MSCLSFIVAELSSGYFWQRWLTILAFGPHLLSLSSRSCPFFWIASTSSFCASLRMDPHRLVSLPPAHPLLCLHLRSLHRRSNVTAVLPLFSVVYWVCVMIALVRSESTAARGRKTCFCGPISHIPASFPQSGSCNITDIVNVIVGRNGNSDIKNTSGQNSPRCPQFSHVMVLWCSANEGASWAGPAGAIPPPWDTGGGMVVWVGDDWETSVCVCVCVCVCLCVSRYRGGEHCSNRRN